MQKTEWTSVMFEQRAVSSAGILPLEYHVFVHSVFAFFPMDFRAKERLTCETACSLSFFEPSIFQTSQLLKAIVYSIGKKARIKFTLDFKTWFFKTFCFSKKKMGFHYICLTLQCFLCSSCSISVVLQRSSSTELIYIILLYIIEQKALEEEKEQLQRQLKKRQRQQEKQLKREAYEALERQKKMMAEETDRALKG